ncbi:hypothetical protein CLCR_10869 [Cladophialophora carrionii]|uniref:Clr5 domain-containing protein n=1 Tax=Cladophialophora carrionii TaxID=86049 RepID=A0A1C1CX56_9EURO|nr:hypothetical protein CLCR_10869 [Cladophialophora carrionii]
MQHRSNARAPPIAEAEWDRHRSVIEGLYRLHELADVIERMERGHGFHATEKQYKRQFARWGIRKNFSSNDMKGVLGRPTENAIVRGVQVPKAKITRFERRQRLKASTTNRDQIRVQQEDLSRLQRSIDSPSSTGAALASLSRHAGSENSLTGGGGASALSRP